MLNTLRDNIIKTHFTNGPGNIITFDLARVYVGNTYSADVARAFEYLCLHVKANAYNLGGFQWLEESKYLCAGELTDDEEISRYIEVSVPDIITARQLAEAYLIAIFEYVGIIARA